MSETSETGETSAAGETSEASGMRAEEIKAAVDAVLARSRLPVGDEDYARLLRMYPFLQEQIAQLRLPEARYREPGLVFRPHPPVQ